MRIHTTFVYPPIPIRSYDWQAICDEYEELAGNGASEQQAIEDLMQQLEELESRQ